MKQHESDVETYGFQPQGYIVCNVASGCMSHYLKLLNVKLINQVGSDIQNKIKRGIKKKVTYQVFQ